MAESDGEEDFHFWGTPVEDEVEMRAGQHRKEVRDAASTRALPLHKQEVTDAEGRRRLHGAFTGGWSAGYYNTVGSKEGWQPGEFRSSRGARAAVQQSVEQFLDEDELEELRKTNLQTTQEYDTFGSTAAEMARRAAAEAAAERPSAIPGLVPDEVVAPVADSVGIRLLQKMGWRQGKGIGTGDAAQQQEEGGGEGGRPRRRWGQHAAVAPENTQLYLLAPKTDVHGLGFDPFKGAEDFRRLKEQAREAARPKTTAEARKRRRGIAFGSGVLDDEDGYGEGATMEDYVTHDEVEDYDETVQDDGLPRSRGPRVQRSGLGDRLAAKGYSFEIMDEEEEEPQRLLGWSGQEQQRQYALPGRAEPLMLQSREQQVKNSLIPGFVLATRTITFAYFPPPHLPPGYVPLHRTAQPAEAAAPAAAARFAPPQADPPADPELRQAIDSLAFFVAKNGVIFENMARQKQQKEGRWSFLSGGLGADYYRWKVHSLKSIIQPQQQRAPPRAIGQRSAPLSADERGALLGEQQLPATQQGWAASLAGAAGKAPGAEQPQALRRQLMNVAEADRQRLQQMLTRSFVAAESQEMLQPGAAAEAAAGLRPGAPAPPPRAPVNLAAGGIGKVVTEADLARQVDASAQPAAGGGLSLHPAGGTGQQQGAAAAKRLPVRRVEEWRPAALLCKRFNVADPYQGRPAELQMSRFKTDHLALPDTAAAVAATLNAVPAGAQDFLLPPTVAAALAEAEAKQLQQQAGQPAAAPQGQLLSAQAVAMTAQQAQQAQQAPQDAAGAADAFLSSLSDMLGGGGEAAMAAGAAPPPLLPEQQPEAEAAVPTAAVEAERPVDLFKAIFEDSDEELEEEQPPEQQPQPAAQQSEQQQQQAAAAGQPPLPLGPPPPQQQPEEAAFGFAKLRQPAPPPLPPGPPPPLPAGQAPLEPGLGAGAPAAASAGAGIDDALKQRVQDALRALKKDKKEKRGSNKRKKEKKEKRGKEKSRKHKKDSKERRRKEERRRRSGGSSSDSRSSGSSDSD